MLVAVGSHKTGLIYTRALNFVKSDCVDNFTVASYPIDRGYPTVNLRLRNNQLDYEKLLKHSCVSLQQRRMEEKNGDKRSGERPSRKGSEDRRN